MRIQIYFSYPFQIRDHRLGQRGNEVVGRVEVLEFDQALRINLDY